MKKSLIILILSLLLWGTAKAQQDTVLYYMKNSGALVHNKDSADYFRVVISPDTSVDKKLFVVYEFYRNGKTKMMGKSLNRALNLNLEGFSVSFFPNGKRSNVFNYKDGKFVGDQMSFYPNGKLYQTINYNDNQVVKLIECRDSTGKVLAGNGNGSWVNYDENFKDTTTTGAVKDSLQQGEWHGMDGQRVACVNTYNKGDFVSGIFYFESGETYKYSAPTMEPAFPGGVEGFYKFLGSKVRYPDDAKANDIQGKVITKFVIEKNGTLSHIENVKSPIQSMGDEVIRAVKLSPLWMPPIQNGMPVRMQYTFSFAFTIADH